MKKNREYKYMNHGRELTQKVEYDLLFENNKLLKVYNEYHHSIKEQSECFQYFKKIYEK